MQIEILGFMGICIYYACPGGGSKTLRRGVKEQPVQFLFFVFLLFPAKNKQTNKLIDCLIL